ncbi:MAG: hypothetical protein RLZ12_332 [Bacillota bacterium]|jgi:hypothetical protein
MTQIKKYIRGIVLMAIMNSGMTFAVTEGDNNLPPNEEPVFPAAPALPAPSSGVDELASSFLQLGLTSRDLDSSASRGRCGSSSDVVGNMGGLGRETGGPGGPVRRTGGLGSGPGSMQRREESALSPYSRPSTVGVGFKVIDNRRSCPICPPGGRTYSAEQLEDHFSGSHGLKRN